MRREERGGRRRRGNSNKKKKSRGPHSKKSRNPHFSCFFCCWLLASCGAFRLINKKKQKNQAGRLARFARVAREHHHGAREPEERRPRSARAALVHGGGDGGGGGGSRFPSLNGDRERLWCRSRCRAFATARGVSRLRTGIWHEEHTARRQLQPA